MHFRSRHLDPWLQIYQTLSIASAVSCCDEVTGIFRDMATSNVTVSVESDLLEQIRAEAEASGMSVSAWMARAARAFARKDRTRRHQAWLAGNADVAQDLADFEAFARRNRPVRSSLGDPA